MTVVALLNVALDTTALAVIAVMLLWATVTEEELDRRPRSLHLFREPRIRSLDAALRRDGAQPPTSKELQ
jgi:hypothetical protein